MSDAEDGDSRREFDDEEEETDEEEDGLTERIAKATSAMKTIFNGEASEHDIDRFIADHREVVTHGNDRDGTFLHKIVQLVYERSIKATDVKPLVKRLMKDYPYLLRTLNNEEQNPLYRAIQLKRYTWKLVDYMLSSCSDPQCIRDALERPCGEDRSAKTSLTLAFEKGLNDDALQKLVSHASEKALGLPDGAGRTPFHCAVQYDQCSDERVGVIKLLLSRDSKAIREQRATQSSRPSETFLDHKYTRREDRVEYSVYGEHERTAKAYLEELAKKERESKMREAEQDRADDKVPSLKEKDAPKSGRLEKDPKSQSAEARERRGRKPEQDRRSRKQETEQMDENEKLRQELKRQEREREEERKAGGAARQHQDQVPDRAKQLKDQKERPDNMAMSGLRVQTSQAGSDHAPNTPLKRVSTQTFNIDSEKKKREKKITSSKRPAAKRPSSKVLANNSAKILNMLKLHYMRTRSIMKVTSFLYGKNIQQDIQICFDYEGLPSEIHDHVFNERFGADDKNGIRFDKVLMYVRFPNVDVIRNGRKAPKPRARGRQDMEFFFNWLYAKGVRHILKVEVEDGGKIPHSDESIQTSLEKIVVEHLDWKKADLDPRVICQLSSKADNPSSSEADTNDEVTGTRNRLREVTLEWSGNSAALRAWSEPEGLPQLQDLEVVNLRFPAYSDLFDTKSWVDSNLREFRFRLNRNANEDSTAKKTVSTIVQNEPGTAETLSEHNSEITNSTTLRAREIKVHEEQVTKGTETAVSTSGAPKTTGRSNLATEHEWLNCMERFAGCMDIFWKRTLETAHQSLGQDQDDTRSVNIDIQTRKDLQKDVVVALIDDGVDSCDPAFAGRVIEGKTFDYQDGGVGQYYISAKSHGTEMARMILKAIEAALEKKATIISMSWTIPVPTEGSEERRLLDSVLERACKQNVAMFCSSPDQISASEHYPSAFRRQRFFLIGAAHDDGSAYGHAGKSNDFIFPGVNVNTASGSSLPLYLADKTSSTKESTGSSVATALAAGLAALIIHCFKASALITLAAKTHIGNAYKELYQPIQPVDVDRISKYDSLKAAFSRIEKMENGQFMKVWEKFGPVSAILEDNSKSEKEQQDQIMVLCSGLRKQ